MSEDNKITNEILESIDLLSSGIAHETDTIRGSLLKINDLLHPFFKRAGIVFAGEPKVKYDRTEMGDREYRLFISRNSDYNIVIEYTDNQRSPAQYCVGWNDPFSSETETITFKEVRRALLVKVVEVLPSFVITYVNELKRRHQKYSDVAKKAKAIMESI